MELMENWNPNRYSVINTKCPREILMLRGSGCFWKRCSFCDYHLDCSDNIIENYELNKTVINQITGVYKCLEIINSGSFFELDNDTINNIISACNKYKITDIYIECHYKYREKLNDLYKMFSTTKVHAKLGVETFDVDFREKFFNKGMGQVNVSDIVKYYEDCCLHVGVKGQNKAQILNDIEIANKSFTRICINVFIENGTNCKRDEDLISWFINEVLPTIKDNPKFDILVDDSAFGVGGVCSN